MTLVRRIARPMLATIFITGGIEQLRKPSGHAQAAGDVPNEVADAVPVSMPDDPVTLVKIDAAVKVIGGLLLATGGRLARLGALACAASLVPTTYAGHRFWEADDPEEKAEQQIHFMKNVSLLGGLLIAAADTGGRPSVPYLAKKGAASVRRTATDHLPG